MQNISKLEMSLALEIVARSSHMEGGAQSRKGVEPGLAAGITSAPWSPEGASPWFERK